MWQLKTQLLTYTLGIYYLGLATYYNENEDENEKQTYCIVFYLRRQCSNIFDTRADLGPYYWP